MKITFKSLTKTQQRILQRIYLKKVMKCVLIKEDLDLAWSSAYQNLMILVGYGFLRKDESKNYYIKTLPEGFKECE